MTSPLLREGLLAVGFARETDGVGDTGFEPVTSSV